MISLRSFSIFGLFLLTGINHTAVAQLALPVGNTSPLAQVKLQTNYGFAKKMNAACAATSSAPGCREFEGSFGIGFYYHKNDKVFIGKTTSPTGCDSAMNSFECNGDFLVVKLDLVGLEAKNVRKITLRDADGLLPNVTGLAGTALPRLRAHFNSALGQCVNPVNGVLGASSDRNGSPLNCIANNASVLFDYPLPLSGDPRVWEVPMPDFSFTRASKTDYVDIEVEYENGNTKTMRIRFSNTR